MKKTYFFFAVITAAAFAAVSCNSELEANLPEDGSKHTIIVESEAPTKTYIDEGGVVHWADSGDELGIVYRYMIEGMWGSTMTKQTGGYTIDAVGRAKHSVEISIQSGATEYRLMAFYPYIGSSPSSSKKVTLSVPKTQTPADGSYDPKADCLISTNPKSFSSLPDKVSFSYHRPVAIAKMTLLGIGTDEKISKIEFTADENIAGSFFANLWDEDLSERVTYTGGSYSKTITLDMQDRVATGSDVVYFTTLPADLSGKSFSVKVTTDGHIYSKDVALTDRKFKLEAATLTKFVVANLTVSDLPSEYALLKDASALKAGDKMVICSSGVSANNTYSSQYLLGTEASGSKIAKSDQIYVTDDLTIVEPLPSNARVFTLESAADGKWYLKASDGYLYATYDEEFWTPTLTVTETKLDSWIISVESSGNTAIRSVNCNRYITYSTSNHFSTASSIGTSNRVYAYIISTGDTPEGPTIEKLSTPNISNVSVDGSSVTISWTAVVGAADYDVKLADGYAQTGVTATEYTFTNVPDGTYPASGISVIANPASTDEAHTSSAPASWSSDVVVKTTPDVETETTIVFDLKDYYNKSEFKDSDEIITITHNGSWRKNGVEGYTYDGLFIGSGKFLKVAVANKTVVKIVLYAAVEGGSYKSIGIGSVETISDTGSTSYDSSNGQYLWTGGEERSYVKFSTKSSGGNTYLSKIEVTYK
ncbi:MAG: hypothetical protein MR690_06910 [Rikenellaceae bacterium]|nr:hypothetical protein [Rikenellaceae bacterium]